MAYEYQPAGYWATGYWPVNYWPGTVSVPSVNFEFTYPALVSAYGVHFAGAPMIGHAAPLNAVAPFLGAMAAFLARAAMASSAADPLAKTASAGNAAPLWAEAVVAASDGDKRAISVTTGVAHG
jgi:hypothetical protein